MQLLLLKMANIFSMLGIDLIDQEWYKNIFNPITSLLDSMLVPILIIIGTAGSIYAIVLGVNFSKAETADKREEAKKRMINAVIGIVVMLVMLVLLKLFTANADEIAKWIMDMSGGSTPETETGSLLPWLK